MEVGRKNRGRREGGRDFFAHFTSDLLIMTPCVVTPMTPNSCVRQSKCQYSQKPESNCNPFLALDSLNFKKGRL